MGSLVIHVDVDEATKRWSLRVLAPNENPTAEPPAVLAYLEDHGFGPEEGELCQALDRLDRTIDPAGDTAPISMWWADTWARALDGPGAVITEPPATDPPTEPLGHCVIHGDYWTDDCYRCHPVAPSGT